MKKNDENKKLDEFLNSEKYEEAKQVLEKLLKSKLTDAERGAAYVNFARVYLRVNNSLARQYEEKLDSALAVLKKMNATGKKVEDKLSLSKVRRKISG